MHVSFSETFSTLPGNTSFFPCLILSAQFLYRKLAWLLNSFVEEVTT